VVTRRLQAERRTGLVRQPKTGVRSANCATQNRLIVANTCILQKLLN